MVLESRDVIQSIENGKALWQLCFTAAPAQRREFERSFPKLQSSKEKTSTLAQRYGLNRTTARKWRSRPTTAGVRMCPAQPKSTGLSPAEEAVILKFRRRTLLPLDDIRGSLHKSIPKLSRSSLHRCLLRHGISPLPASNIKMTLPLDCVSHNRAHELACLASHSLSNCIGLT